MNSFTFVFCLPLIYSLPGKMSQNDRKPEVVLTNGSMQTVLPCSIPNAEQVVWEFKPASGDQRTEICKIDKGNEQCDSTLFPNIKLVDLHELRRGNYSLQLVANNTDVGTYYCKSNSSSVQEKEIRLISFKVSATPENAILEGATVQLMLESSDISYFHNMTWSVPSNSVTGKGIEISWSLNNEKISKNSHFEFDYRSLNISRFRSKDTGHYVYTVKRSKGSSAFYSISLQIAGATTSQATTSTTSLSTAGTAASQTIKSLSTTGAITSQTTQSPLTTDSFNNSKSGIIIGGVLIGLVVFLLTPILIVWFIKKHCQSEEGPYVNVRPQRKNTEPDAADMDSTYMGLKLEEQSVYSHLRR
ncbi:uncharacterized protein [Mobula birostris]|uniref:uncharacterized protein isoform X4 n=1 Tax=Mobula birostris TaxID=1983395 RepID=UPI003B28639E